MDTHLTRRSFVIASGGALTAALLAACQPATPTPQPKAAPTAAPAATAVPAAATKPAAPAEKIKLQLSWWPVGGERGLKAMEEALKPFDQAYPNITVERQPTAANYFDKLLTMLAGGTPPDVMAIDNYNITEVADKDVLKDLGPFIDGDKSFTLDVFFPAALKEGVWKGKRWALPYIGSTRIMFYNIDLLQKKGLETPDKLWETGKWTWDMFLEYATKLTDRSGGAATTVYGANDDRNMSGGLPPWIWGAKGDILSADLTKCLMAEAGAVAGIKYVQDLIFKHQVAPKADAMKDIDLVATGRVGMWFSWRGLSMSYRAYTYKWDVVPFPVGPAGKTTLYKGNSMAIAKTTKYPDQSWLLCKHITGPEADKAYVNNGGATPRKDNRETLMKSTPPSNNQYFYDPLNEGWTRMLPFNPKWREWNNDLQKYLDRMFLDNEDVAKVMGEACGAIEKVLKA